MAMLLMIFIFEWNICTCSGLRSLRRAPDSFNLSTVEASYNHQDHSIESCYVICLDHHHHRRRCELDTKHHRWWAEVRLLDHRHCHVDAVKHCIIDHILDSTISLLSCFLFNFRVNISKHILGWWMAAQNLSINDRHSHLVAIKVNDTTRCYQTPHCQSGQLETERDPIVRITWSMVNRWHNRRTMSSRAIIARWPENTSQYQNTRMFLQIFLLVQLTPRCCPCKKTCGRAPALPPSLCVNSCVNRRSWLKRKPLIVVNNKVIIAIIVPAFIICSHTF